MSNKLIAIVEDDEEMRKFLCEFIEQQGFEVRAFANSASALTFLRSASDLPNLMICDLNLPGMDGIELLATLRTEKLMSPFILITAFGTAETKRRAELAGALEVLMKPFSLSEMSSAIKRAI